MAYDISNRECGSKWAVLKVNDPAKVNGLFKKRRSWAKGDGHLYENERSRVKKLNGPEV